MSDRLREAQEQIAAMRAERAERDPALTLFEEADLAVESVTENAGPVWKEQALDAVYRAAMANTTVTVTDVWMRMDDTTVYDARSIGGVMREARRRGWITPTGQYRPHPDPSAHGRPCQVWRSNITEYYGTHYVAEEQRGATSGGDEP